MKTPALSLRGWHLVLAVLLGGTAYYLTGKLSLLLAIPPGFATAVWPPAGIALASVLLVGPRAGIGVWLGSFLLNMGPALEAMNPHSLAAPVLVAAVIAAGASLQALAGSYLVRRFVGFPNALADEKAVGSFLALGGPISCLVSPCVAVTALCVSGAVGWDQYVFNWCTWWVGDSIGVLLVAPLAVVWRASPEEAWKRRPPWVAAPLAILLALVFLFFTLARRWEEDALRLDFDRRASAASGAVADTLNSQIRVLRSLEALYQVHARVDHRTFRAFASHLLHHHPEVAALSWNAWVAAADRPRYEANGKAECVPSFQITECDPNSGELVRAGDRPEYVSVRYIVPVEGHEKALGYDVASEPDRAAALRQARDHAVPTATSRLALVQDTGARRGILVFLPIFHPGAPQGPAGQQPGALRGYLTAVYRVDEMLALALRGQSLEGVGVDLLDPLAPEGEQLLATFPVRSPSPTGQGGNDLASRPSAEVVFDCAGRQWVVRCSPRRDFFLGHRTWHAWLVLAAGLLVAGLVQAFLLVMTGRAAQTQILVAQRTDQLAGANARLRTEVAERERAEEQLRQARDELEARVRERTEELRRSEERYRTVVEGSIQGIAILQDSIIRYANPRFAAIFGYEDPAELIGHNRDRLIVPEYLSLLRTRGVACLRGEPLPSPLEWEGVRRDGQRIWIESGASRIEWDEAPAILSFIVDVTERKHLEEQFRQSQKMDAVGRLAGGIAHDFNNLLTVINGYSDLLLEEIAIEEEDRERVRHIRHSGEQAAALTRQLLAFSRKQVLRPVVLDLNDLVNEAGKMLRRLIGEDIDFTLVLDPNLARVKADPGQLQQVLLNLAVNARDAMPQGGSLSIQTRNVTRAGPGAIRDDRGRQESYVLLAVRDTGCGMDEETKARIFEPFFTTKEAGRGTGLGLATVDGIIAQSGGWVEVESAPGVGSTFRVYLPRIQEPDTSAEGAAKELPIRGGSETILLVEDEDGVLALAELVLRSYGYTVWAAQEGQEALEIARRCGRPNLLVTDVVLPHMSGRQLAEQLLELYPGLEVLYCSGYTDDEVVRHGVRETAQPFLQKPFTPAALARAVRDLLDRQ